MLLAKQCCLSLKEGELSLFFEFYLSVLMKLDLFHGSTSAIFTWAPACNLNLLIIVEIADFSS